MGSLSSRPSVPTPTPQVVYVPQTMSATTTSSVENTGAENLVAVETASEVRAQNLLGRERSRFGTVLTGFRGLLSTLEDRSPRKTLLGE
ncbi:MAG: hypothetical protein H6860_04240 [Rhodospirillales bacterium]|nr:hypothetical protein [Alphaproteobacteria bacterium]MCB9981589.1 hypothetical protein [Rhodospirillales bacterium]